MILNLSEEDETIRRNFLALSMDKLDYQFLIGIIDEYFGDDNLFDSITGGFILVMKWIKKEVNNDYQHALALLEAFYRFISLKINYEEVASEYQEDYYDDYQHYQDYDDCEEHLPGEEISDELIALFQKKIIKISSDKTASLNFIEYFKKTFKKQKLIIGDEYLGILLSSLEPLYKYPAMHEYLLRFINSKIENGKEKNDDFNYLLSLGYKIITEYKGIEKGLEFAKKHLDYSVFRELLVKKYLKEKDYRKALSLLMERSEFYFLDGIDWDYYLLKAYQGLNDKNKIRELAFKFITKGKKEYYQLFKETFTSDKWERDFPVLIDNYKNDLNLVCYLLKKEAKWDLLLEYISKSEFLYFKYYQAFPKEYHKKLAVLLMDKIKNRLTRVNQTKGYLKLFPEFVALAALLTKNDYYEYLNNLMEDYKKRPALVRVIKGEFYKY